MVYEQQKVTGSDKNHPRAHVGGKRGGIKEEIKTVEYEIISRVLHASSAAEFKTMNKKEKLKPKQISRMRQNSLQCVRADLRKEMCVPTAITMENSLSTSLEDWKIGK